MGCTINTFNSAFCMYIKNMYLTQNILFPSSGPFGPPTSHIYYILYIISFLSSIAINSPEIWQRLTRWAAIIQLHYLRLFRH